MRAYPFIAIASLFFLFGCDLIDIKQKDEVNQPEEKPIARAYDKQLYLKDLQILTPKGISGVDSASFVLRYVESWVRKQVLIHNAANIMDTEIAEIERKVLEYRYALIAFEFEKNYIENNLDTAVREHEIKDYYVKNSQNFELKNNIIRGIFIEVPLEAPKLEQVRNWLEREANDEKAKKELRSYASRFARNYFLEDTVWVSFNGIVKNSPFINIPDQIDFLKRNTLVENRDENFVYYLKIKDFKLSDETSPLSMVSNQIREIIINKRKLQLIKRLEEETYNEAKAKNEFEIFIDQDQ